MDLRYTFLYQVSDKAILAFCEADVESTAEQIFESEMGYSSDGWFDVVRFPMHLAIPQDYGTEFHKDYKLTDDLNGLERLPYLKISADPPNDMLPSPDLDKYRLVTVQKFDKDGVAMVDPEDTDRFVLEVAGGSVNRDAPGKICRECELVNGVYSFQLFPMELTTHGIEVSVALGEQTLVAELVSWEAPAV
jgi:hypothetical protein